MNAMCARSSINSTGSIRWSCFSGRKSDAARLRTFLDYRAELAHRQQEEWIARIEAIRQSKHNLDLVLTHVDDRFDTRMRDLIGADAARLLPLLDQHDFTFLIEDPATIWNLGPQRYPKIAEKYQPLTKQTGKLAIDINIVERYQDVYPTKQQTGTELFQLVHLAAKAFPQVALYFENSILAPDLPLLASAAANVQKFQREGQGMIVDSQYWRRSCVARTGAGERTPLAGSRRDHLVASGWIQRHRTRAERSGHPNTGFQRQFDLGQRFALRPAVLVSKPRSRRGRVKHAPRHGGS